MTVHLLQPALGALLILAVLQDVFFTVLFPASGHGVIRRPLGQWTWRAFRLLAGRLDNRRRRRLLAYSGPVQITLNLGVWILLLTTGWALVFHPALGTQITASSGSTDRGWGDALYYSGYALTTLGVGDIVARTDLYRLLTVTEAAIGFATVTMAITYFLSVYSALTRRKTSAGQLHHRTYGTGAAAALLAGLSADGDLPHAVDELNWMAGAVQDAVETHAGYPVLRYFHERQVYYSIPRVLLLAFDTVTLIRAVLDPLRYRQLLAAPALAGLCGAAEQLLDELAAEGTPSPLTPDEEDAWRRRSARARERLATAGLQVRDDPEAVAREYIRLRLPWDRPLRRLADSMVYDWTTIEPTGSDTVSR